MAQKHRINTNSAACPKPLSYVTRQFVQISLVGLVGVTALLGVPAIAWSAEPEEQTFFERVTAPLVRHDLQVNAAASCSATACHGGPRAGTVAPTAVRGSEYPLWLESDPHARSWSTLCQPESTAILARLGIMRGGEIVDQVGFDNCMACHNTTREFREPRSLTPNHEGVGCASCHGPAEKWASSHYQVNWDADAAVKDGYVPVRNMLARARMCATCHVGDRDRDMNHDIIAAGHPSLLYEFSTFQLRQPKHWREESQADTNRYEASMWLAGQLAGLDASLVLLETRAEQQLPISQWPEFSQFDCSACHQPVQLRDIKEQPTQQTAASAAWSDWNSFGVRALLKHRSMEGQQVQPDQQLSRALDSLQAIMQARTSTPRQAQQAARGARLALDAWLASPEGKAEVAGFTAKRLTNVAVAVAADPSYLNNWDRAAQFYLAAMAARQSWAVRDGANETRNATVHAEELRRVLKFEKGLNSPAPFFRSSTAATRRELTEAIQKLMHTMQPLPQDER